MKKKFIFFNLLAFIIILSTSCFAYYIPTWSELDTTEVNANTTAEDFLNIESQSAILIEQTTRRNTL